MGFADEPAIDLPRADADATVHRQVAVKLRHGHRDAPASVVGNYRVRESGVEHQVFFADERALAAAPIVFAIRSDQPATARNFTGTSDVCST